VRRSGFEVSLRNSRWTRRRLDGRSNCACTSVSTGLSLKRERSKTAARRSTKPTGTLTVTVFKLAEWRRVLHGVVRTRNLYSQSVWASRSRRGEPWSAVAWHRFVTAAVPNHRSVRSAVTKRCQATALQKNTPSEARSSPSNARARSVSRRSLLS
jgi:hypothetical protein